MITGWVRSAMNELEAASFGVAQFLIWFSAVNRLAKASARTWENTALLKES